MRVYASGEAQHLNAPGEFLSPNPFGRVVGLIDLGDNNGCNDFGWTGLKAVIEFEGEEFVLDFPEFTRVETDDGIEIASGDADSILSWWPSREDAQRYGLRMVFA